MQTGVHVIQRDRLANVASDVQFTTDWIGIIDLSRMIDGMMGEPEPGVPLGVIGLDDLLTACTDDPGELMRHFRTKLHGGKEYFEWKKIPVVFLVRGELEYSGNDGLALKLEEEIVSLAPLLGKSFNAAKPEATGWWWTPQFG